MSFIPWDIVELLERRQLDVGYHARTHVSSDQLPFGSGLFSFTLNRTVACSLAFGPGLDFFGGSRGAGTGSPHHRHVGHCLRQRWSHGPWLRTVGEWLPLFRPRTGTSRPNLKAASYRRLPEKPRQVGIERLDPDAIGTVESGGVGFVSRVLNASGSRRCAPEQLPEPPAPVQGFVLKRPKKRLGV